LTLALLQNYTYITPRNDPKDHSAGYATNNFGIVLYTSRKKPSW